MKKDNVLYYIILAGYKGLQESKAFTGEGWQKFFSDNGINIKNENNPFICNYYFHELTETKKKQFEELTKVGNRCLYHYKLNSCGPIKLVTCAKYVDLDKNNKYNIPLKNGYRFFFFKNILEFKNQEIKANDIYNLKYFVNNSQLYNTTQPHSGVLKIDIEPAVYNDDSLKAYANKGYPDLNFIAYPSFDFKENRRNIFVVTEAKLSELIAQNSIIQNYDILFVVDKNYTLKSVTMYFNRKTMPYSALIDQKDITNANLNLNELLKQAKIRYIQAQNKKYKTLVENFVGATIKDGFYKADGKRGHNSDNANFYITIAANIKGENNEYSKFIKDADAYKAECEKAALMVSNPVFVIEVDNKQSEYRVSVDGKQRGKLISARWYLSINHEIVAELALKTLDNANNELVFEQKAVLADPLKLAKTYKIDEYRKIEDALIYDRLQIIDSEVEEKPTTSAIKVQSSNQTTEFDKFGNVIFYGVPGCGKSYFIKCLLKNVGKEYWSRILFHPEYTYSDFVGQLEPTQVNGKPVYKFVAGPFTKILKKALLHADKHYYFIIEEINRGNAPEIFGDIFQLLDRNEDNESEYHITNEQILKYLKSTEDLSNEEKDILYELQYKNNLNDIYLPSNLYIFATMNTCDQNVFAIDTAFKRRWRMHRIENSFDMNINDNKEFSNQKNHYIAGMMLDQKQLTWRAFAKAINEKIVEQNNSLEEDKQLGVWFVNKNELDDVLAFGEKVLMYLWNDVFRFNRNKIFNEEYKTLDAVINQFVHTEVLMKESLQIITSKGLFIFNDDVLNLMKNINNEKN